MSIVMIFFKLINVMHAIVLHLVVDFLSLVIFRCLMTFLVMCSIVSRSVLNVSITVAGILCDLFELAVWVFLSYIHQSYLLCLAPFSSFLSFPMMNFGLCNKSSVAFHERRGEVPYY